MTQMLDMASVGVKHNDIFYAYNDLSNLKWNSKIKLLVLDGRFTLVDFGWATINDKVPCNVSQHNFPRSGMLEDTKALAVLDLISGRSEEQMRTRVNDEATNSNFQAYKDRRRKGGSQSESASFTVDGDSMIHVAGYQQYDLKDGHVILHKGWKEKKFDFLKTKLAAIRRESPALKTFLDIGCSAGLTSLLAKEAGFEHVTSLDHDSEYIQLIRDITAKDGIQAVDAREFSFGDPFPVKADIAFMGALIHWVFSCTSDFGSFDRIMDYLLTAVDKVLLIEWVDPKDGAIKSFHHDTCGATPEEPYTVEGFERALAKVGTVVGKWEIDGSYRVLYQVEIHKTDEHIQ